MGAEVVQHDDLPVPQARGKPLLDVGLEDLGSRGAFHRQTRPHPLQAHARKQRGVRPPIARDLGIYALLPFEE
jgi:hypothetical protein